MTRSVLMGVSVPISSSGLVDRVLRVNGVTAYDLKSTLATDSSSSPIFSVLTVWPPVFASISGSMTSSRGAGPSTACACAKSERPARATASSNLAGAGGVRSFGSTCAAIACTGSADGAVVEIAMAGVVEDPVAPARRGRGARCCRRPGRQRTQSTSEGGSGLLSCGACPGGTRRSVAGASALRIDRIRGGCRAAEELGHHGREAGIGLQVLRQPIVRDQRVRHRRVQCDIGGAAAELRRCAGR